jgi:hypothetical protein
MTSDVRGGSCVSRSPRSSSRGCVVGRSRGGVRGERSRTSCADADTAACPLTRRGDCFPGPIVASASLLEKREHALRLIRDSNRHLTAIL